VKRIQFSWIVVIFLTQCGIPTCAHAQQVLPVYFDLGNRLTEDFQGTYEFKHKHLEFVRKDGGTYSVNSSGDQSPSQARVVAKNGYVYWVLGQSGERWIALKATLRRGDKWHHRLEGWDQLYRVAASDETVSVPAGLFPHCARVEVSWSANEHDMRGPQKVVYYLAPHLGIIKREVWSNGEKWHEEVLSRYETR
jgi:hypothetical protein